MILFFFLYFTSFFSFCFLVWNKKKKKKENNLSEEQWIILFVYLLFVEPWKKKWVTGPWSIWRVSFGFTACSIQKTKNKITNRRIKITRKTMNKRTTEYPPARTLTTFFFLLTRKLQTLASKMRKQKAWSQR